MAGVYEAHTNVIFTADNAQLKKVMKENRGVWVDSKKVMQDNVEILKERTKMDEKGNITREQTIKQQRRFRAELLSILFFGMSIQRMFGGQIDRIKSLIGTQKMVEGFYNEALIGPAIEAQEEMSKWLELWEMLPGKVKDQSGEIMLDINKIGTALSGMGQIWLGLRGLEDITGIEIPKIAKALRKMGLKKAGFLIGGWALAITGAITISLKSLEDARDLIIEIKDLLGMDPGEKRREAVKATVIEEGLRYLTTPFRMFTSPMAYALGFDPSEYLSLGMGKLGGALQGGINRASVTFAQLLGQYGE